MLLARVVGADDEPAIEIAGWSCVALLACWGVVVARRERESTLGIVRTSAGCPDLGLTMIVLKAVH